MTLGANCFGWPYPAAGYGGFTPVTPPVVVGPGNGGELFGLALAANGTSSTAHLAAAVTLTSTQVLLSSDSGLPTTSLFPAIIDDEVLIIGKIGTGRYRIYQRAASNTVIATHTSGTNVVWTDSYDMAIESESNADTVVTVVVDSVTYDQPGWVVVFDSSQAYLGGDRYPFHVAELVGVFSPGEGSTGTNKVDQSQPTSISVPGGVSDDCPAALTVPALIIINILVGDVALARYTNPEASTLIVGSRSTAIQTFYGFKRVNDDDTVDVTFTDPNGHIVDGTVEEAFDHPATRFITTTLLGDDRVYTYGPPRFSEAGWPFAALAVRQGNHRVPYWTSPDWHNFNFVYSGFGQDATYVQVLINRNGFIEGTHPTVDLPGPQDIDGPNATWDDGNYFFATAWYVVLFQGPYILTGPTLNGGGGGGGGSGGGGSGGGGGGTVGFPPGEPPVITPPDDTEGGSGGGIGVPAAALTTLDVEFPI